MNNEFKKMLSGKIYDPSDSELFNLRTKAHKLCNKYNQTNDDEVDIREKIINELIPNNNGVYLQGPIYFDYGVNTSFGTNCFVNFNFTVLDICPIKIGNNVFFGPNVSVVTPIHPLLPEERMMYKNDKGIVTDREYAKPITIEDNCWIASNCVICGGVTIGKNTVIGAGSIVVKDIPSGVFAAGNPCKVIRKLTPEDSIYLKKELF